MKRINVTLYDETFEILSAQAKKNGGKSIAQQIREAVDLWIKIEAATQKNQENGNDFDPIKLQEMIKNNLIWTLESRLLSRYLVERLPADDKQNPIEILEKFKEKARSYVEGMLDADVQ